MGDMGPAAILLLIPVAMLAIAGARLLGRTLGRARFNRAIARFERGLAFPTWPPPPREASARERALGSPPIEPRSG